jgi:hypothetical protein
MLVGRSILTVNESYAHYLVVLEAVSVNVFIVSEPT